MFRIEISDSCKWEFDFDGTRDLRLTANGKRSMQSWDFELLPPSQRPVKKVRIRIAGPAITVCAVVPDDCPPLLTHVPPDYCMLATGDFSVNMTLMEPACPINVKIVRFLNCSPVPMAI